MTLVVVTSWIGWKTTSKSCSATIRRISCWFTRTGTGSTGDSIKAPMRSATLCAIRRSTSARWGLASRLTADTMPTVTPSAPTTGTPT